MHNSSAVKSLSFAPLLRVMLALTLIVIGMGVYTRLADAGLGCPDWPGCYGHWLLPLDEKAQAHANARWPDSPVDIQRAALELAHRVVAGLLGLLVLILGLLSLRARKHVLLAWTAVLLVVVQALFGMWTVTLKLLPQIVSAHLLGGFGLLTILYFYYLRLFDSVRISRGFRTLRIWAWLGLTLVVTQIGLGGWLSANYAAIACPDFPTCQGQWIPPTNFPKAFNVMQSIGFNYLGGLLDNTARVTIHITHRFVALLLAFYLMVLSILVLRASTKTHLRMAIYAMLGILFLQLCLGISNVLFSFPILIAIAHNLVGALLLLSMTRVLYFLYYDIK